MTRILFALTWLLISAVAGAEGLDNLPRYLEVRLAPDGKHLLMLQSNGDSYDLVVGETTSDKRWVALAAAEQRGLFNWCAWANDTRIVCSLRFNRGTGGIGQLTYTRLIAVDYDGENHKALIPRARNQPRRDPMFNAQLQDRILSWLPGRPEEIAVQLNRDDANRPGVYLLNIYTNTLGRLVRPRDQIRRWFVNSEGEPRMAMGFENEETPVLYSYKNARPRRYENPAYGSEVPPTPLAFTNGDEEVYMNMTNGEDTHGIYRVRVADGEVLETVYTDPDYDVFAQLVQHPDTGAPAGVLYTRDHPTMVWFDETLDALFKQIKRQVPGEHLELVSSDRNYNHFVLYAYGGISPGYFLFKRQSMQVVDLGRDFPGLRDEEVVDLQPVSYTSKDGLEIPAFIALPQNAKAGPVPAVLLPHGGPYARDSARFDQWTQFLVSQGVAVLKPNYRGSVGYGELFMRSGYKQWGLKMQEDLMDGLSWLVAEGIADPEKVCVVGASFGGYTALVSAYRYSERINCAVSLAGISDLKRMVRRIYEFDLVRRNRDRIQSNSELKDNSPYHQAEHFDVPVLLVHGDQDSVVRVRQSRQMAEALARHNKPFEFIEQENGDHHLSVGRHRQEFFNAMGRFLATHLELNL